MSFSLRQTLLGALLLLASLPLQAQKKTEEKDSLVRLMSAQSAQMVVERGVSYRKVFGPARFLHNDTYLICDTAWWNVDRGLIKATGHVKILQDETELTGDYLDYIIDDNLAQFRGGVVQLKDKDNNLLRTSHLDYNTRDSVAVFDHGGSMKDKDGQVIESVRGTYDAKIKLFTFEHDVNMFTDSVFVKTSRLEYSSPENEAVFGFNTNAWKDDGMLSADSGWYKRDQELFFFTRKVHILTATQEGWCDSLYFRRLDNQTDMFGHAEVADSVRKFNALAGHISYSDTLKLLEMKRSPAIRAISEEDERRDTTYMAGDYIRYQTIPRFEVDSMEVVHSGERMADILSDPVQEYRRKAAEAAAKALSDAQAKKDAEDGKPGAVPGNSAPSAAPKQTSVSKAPPEDKKLPPPADSPSTPFADSPRAAAPDSLATAVTDSLATAVRDSLASAAADNFAADTLASVRDTLASTVTDTLATAVTDTLATAASDSLAVAVPLEPKDSTKIGFVTAPGHVRVFRRDMQTLCDSLAFTELDSIARLYRNPVVWNEGNRQYSSDSIAVLIRNQALDRASLMSDAFIIIQEDSLHFDQIKSAEMLAFFDDEGQLRRFDALGGANALFYLEENDALATVNTVETKMMSVLFREGAMDRIHYFESVKNDAYPTVLLPEDQKELKGFNWRDAERPKGPEDLMPVQPRETQRKNYESRPHAKFSNTDKYFPGYMDKVNKKLADEKVKREQRRREREERERERKDSLSMAETIAPADSTALSPVDTIAVAPVDSTLALPVAVDSTLTVPSVADSLATVTPKALSPEEQKAAEKAEAKAKKEADKAERERLRREKEAAREARWEYLDSLDQAKDAAKAAKKREKIRRRNEKILQKEQKRIEREQRLFEKYRERYERKKAKEEARAAAKASSKSAKAPSAEAVKPEEITAEQSGL